MRKIRKEIYVKLRAIGDINSGFDGISTLAIKVLTKIDIVIIKTTWETIINPIKDYVWIDYRNINKKQ